MGTLSHQPEIKITADGSCTLYLEDIGETYHSTHGAIQESEHVFINTGLKHCKKNEISILEVGFGTGLNAFLSYIFANDNQHIKFFYTALEKFPIDHELVMQLNYTKFRGNEEIFNQLHLCEWGKAHKISENFFIEKIKTDFTGYNHKKTYDIIYFDAFSPDKQPEMWTEDIFRELYHHSNSGSILTTYCAKGSVRRAMKAAGYKVERLSGPPGKREMLRATKSQ